MSDETTEISGDAGAEVSAASEPSPSEDVSAASAGGRPPPISPGNAADTPLAAGVEEEDSSPAPQDWPSNWRDIMSGGDEKALKSLGHFNSPANVFKSWQAMRNKMSAGEIVPAKPDTDDADEINAWRVTAGIPETAEGYLDGMPDGIVVGEDDIPIIGDFLQHAHETDTPPKHVHDMLSWYYQHEENLLAQRYENDINYRQQSEDELRSDWGPEFRANLNGIHNTLDTYGEEGLADAVFSSRMADGTLLGDNPAFIRMLADISSEINPHPVVTPATGESVGQTIANEKAQIEHAMADRNSDYWRGPKDPNTGETMMAQRYRELLEAEERVRTRATRNAEMG